MLICILGHICNMFQSASQRLTKKFFPHDSKSYHFQFLDGLRGLAVLLVMLAHTSNYGIKIANSISFSGIGKSGVYLFFILSSYLLDRQIAIAYDQHKATIKFWLNYFLRRFLRIYPLFFLILILNYAITSITGLDYVQSMNASELWQHLILQGDKSVFWSIPVEFKYYFISPLIMLFLFKVLKWKKNSVYIAILAFIVVSYYLALEYKFTAISTMRFLIFFLTGTFLAVVEIKDGNQLSILPKRTKQFLSFMGFVVLFIYLFRVPFVYNGIFNKGITNYFMFDYISLFPFHTLLWAIVLVCAKYGTSIFRKIFTWTPLRFLGSISYSLYLLHMLVLLFIYEYLLPVKLNAVSATMYFILFIIGSLIVASISYLLIEHPLSKIRLTKQVHLKKPVTVNP